MSIPRGPSSPEGEGERKKKERKGKRDVHLGRGGSDSTGQAMLSNWRSLLVPARIVGAGRRITGENREVGKKRKGGGEEGGGR